MILSMALATLTVTFFVSSTHDFGGKIQHEVVGRDILIPLVFVNLLLVILLLWGIVGLAASLVEKLRFENIEDRVASHVLKQEWPTWLMATLTAMVWVLFDRTRDLFFPNRFRFWTTLCKPFQNPKALLLGTGVFCAVLLREHAPTTPEGWTLWLGGVGVASLMILPLNLILPATGMMWMRLEKTAFQKGLSTGNQHRMGRLSNGLDKLCEAFDDTQHAGCVLRVAPLSSLSFWNLLHVHVTLDESQAQNPDTTREKRFQTWLKHENMPQHWIFLTTADDESLWQTLMSPRQQIALGQNRNSGHQKIACQKAWSRILPQNLPTAVS